MLMGYSGQAVGSMGTPLQTHAPGFLICTVIALSANFLSEHYGELQRLCALAKETFVLAVLMLSAIFFWNFGQN